VVGQERYNRVPQYSHPSIGTDIEVRTVAANNSVETWTVHTTAGGLRVEPEMFIYYE
jgi:hypothetical protein